MAISDVAVQVSPEVNQFLSGSRKLLIDGQWVDAVSGKTFPVYNPATGEVMANVAEGDKEDINRAVQAARRAFETGPWAKMSPSERGQLIYRLADLIEKNVDEFAQLESLDNGKPLTLARAADVPLTIDHFRYMSGWATKIEGNTIPVPGDYFSYTLRQPIGVVGQIIPWNFPLLMAAWKLGAALAVGCTIVLKPAEQTPLSALRLGELILEAGFPAGVVNIVPGYGETAGAALAAHDTDVQTAIAGAANAIFFNQGEVCSAGSRLFVDKSIFDQVVEGVAEQAKNIKVGPGFDPSTQMGPLVSDEQLARVTGYLQSGVTEGAKTVTGGQRSGERGYFVQPTVIVNANEQMKIVQEEIFGPVVVATPFDDLDEIAATANNTVYGLAAGVWTRDISKAHKLAKLLRAGTVWVNCYSVFDAALPFGGFKQSGWGREMGHEALNNYLETKTVTIGL